MIDIKLIRENPQTYIDGAKVKKIEVDINRLLEVDAELRKNKQKLQDITTEKNRIGKDIPKLDPDKKKEALAELSKLKQDELDYNEAIKNLQPEFDALMGQVAQPADPEVPVGEDVAPGDRIVTSGYGGVFPPGLLIGYVSEVSEPEGSMFKKIEVQPAAKLNRFEEVFVLVEIPQDSIFGEKTKTGGSR